MHPFLLLPTYGGKERSSMKRAESLCASDSHRPLRAQKGALCLILVVLGPVSVTWRPGDTYYRNDP